MSTEFLLATLLTVITAATPLVYAAIGELVTERSGVLNLGVEGMMLMGAVAAFGTSFATGSDTLAILAGLGAGMLMALLFGVLALSLQASQVATGLALTIFGIGLSALVGKPLVGQAIDSLPKIPIPGLAEIPFLGPLLFKHDVLVYGSFVMVVLVAFFLAKSRAGLVLRAVGDSHDAAHALGLGVIRVRYLATLFGGAMSGLAGAYLSLAYTPLWTEAMSAGRGWIALALVVFATWRPARVLFGAYLFGGVSILQLHAQAGGLEVASQFMSMLPYLATIIVLVLVSRDRGAIRRHAPAAIGKPFHPVS
ncbi:MAG: ABC transporter permease [Gammaproteobacteria bacterium]|nr:MAG: ABC transporter permease [Gammaproteobacteria bacterium]